MSNSQLKSLDCPSSDELSRLLDDTLPPGEREQIECHLGECSRCQAHLGQLAIDPHSEPNLALMLQPARRARHTDTANTRSQQTVSERLEIPGYEIIEQLGRGGAGVVYRAYDRHLCRNVALKVLTGVGPEHAIRFRDEAEAAARLQHPNIIEVFASGSDDARMYLVMELIEGGDLAERLRESPLAPRQAAALTETLARAIHHAHRAGILHRDLKPANILLQALDRSQAATGLLPKITDFGLAYRLDARRGLTHTGELIGTPGYMPPEQALASSGWATERVDVYSLGAILYECLTGRPPFQGESAAATIDLVVRSEPVPPRQLNPRLPRDLETICLKCLEKQAARRYSSAEEMADDLRRFTSGVPIRALPVSRLERARKWCRRNPGAAGMMGVSLMAAWLFILAWASFTQQLREQTTIANQKAREAQANLAALVDSNDATNEVLRFITTDLFDAAIPDNHGINLTVVDALRRSEAGIDERFAGRPKAEAAIRSAVGNVYDQLGQPLRAIVHLERAVALYSDMNDSTLRSAEFDTRRAYIICLRELGRDADAKRQFMELQTGAWQPDDQQQLELRHTELGFLMADRNWKQAMKELDLLLRDCRHRLGDGHSTTRSVFGDLAVVHFRAGDLDKALEMWREDFQRSSESLGRDHLHTLTAANNLAFGYVQQGKFPEAEALHRETYDLKLRSLGALHHETIGAKRSISMVVWRQARREEAIQLLEEVVDEQVAVFGPLDRHTVSSLHQLTRMYFEVEDFESGARVYAKRVEPHLQNSPHDPEWISVTITCARHLTSLGEWNRARQLLDYSHQMLERHWPVDGGRKNMLQQAEQQLDRTAPATDAL